MPLSRPTSSVGGTEAVEDLFATLDALAVAELVKTRELGARELLDGTLHKLRALDGARIRRCDHKPVAPRPLARRIVGRLRGRRSGAWPADGACHRRRRLD